MPRKKKFIDRKNAVTFHLVHRSQQDPLAADETAPQHVLIPVAKKSKLDPKTRFEEQQKFGIYYDDDYNYLQHLRDINNKTEWIQVDKAPSNNESKLQLPSSIFASAVEENVGLLNKAAPISGPRLDLDPDVVAAMDDDFDYSDPENELEDNFIDLANAECSDEEFESDVDSEDLRLEEMDEVCSLDGSQFTFNDEETKSRFTEYSMTSSVMRRNEQLTLLDNRFEKMFSGYDDGEIGALECEEIEGFVPETSDVLLQYAEEFEKSRKRDQLDKSNAAYTQQYNSDEEQENNSMLIELPEKEKWDCESILSTYSTLYNHPKVISEPKQPPIKISMKTGIPINVFASNKLTAKALTKLNEQNNVSIDPKSIETQSVISTLSTLSIRPKKESAQERKDRKQLLKEYRRERRIEKKANSLAFKEETKRQIKINSNNKSNVQGNRLV